MIINEKTIQRVNAFLAKKKINLEDIECFSFMKRYSPPRKGNTAAKDKFGPGVLTLHLKQGTKKAFYLNPFTNASAIIRYLVTQNIKFENYQPKEATATEITPKTYRRFSLLIPYYLLNIMIMLWATYQLSTYGIWWTAILGVGILGIGIFLVYSILKRFCYLKLDKETISIERLIQSRTFRYSQLRKVNFDFAREQIFTLIMEVLDEDYNYHLYYIGRVPRMKLNEIAEILRQKGIDATCSLDKWKRFYGDRYDNP